MACCSAGLLSGHGLCSRACLLVSDAGLLGLASDGSCSDASLDRLPLDGVPWRQQRCHCTSRYVVTCQRTRGLGKSRTPILTRFEILLPPWFLTSSSWSLANLSESWSAPASSRGALSSRASSPFELRLSILRHAPASPPPLFLRVKRPREASANHSGNAPRFAI